MLHGFINLNKALSWTSHDCVARVRRLLNTKKVGHGGTLDPLASGVLPIAIGRATRLLPYLPSSKAYRAVIRFGVTTTTDDLEGDVITQKPAAHLSRQRVEAVLSQFVGTIEQRPPMYSAIQVDGKRLYDLARKGKTAEVPMRQVTIRQLISRSWTAGEQPELTLDVDCGPGTYIRSLARDLGETLGTGATLAELCRTHSNGFDLARSLTLEALETAIEAGTFEPVAAGDVMNHLDAIALPPSLALRWRMGQKLALRDVLPTNLNLADKLTAFNGEPDTYPLRILSTDTRTFLGIGEIREGFKPKPANPKPANPDPANPDPANSKPANPTEELLPTGKILAPKRVFLAVD
ncbi:MAG: tRNA pseudouridine(55) synthase TruB [Cyanobacteria bacterium J06554_3]